MTAAEFAPVGTLRAGDRVLARGAFREVRAVQATPRPGGCYVRCTDGTDWLTTPTTRRHIERAEVDA